MNQKNYAQTGFSLIEVMVVMATIAVMVSISGGLMVEVFRGQERLSINNTLNVLRNQYMNHLREENTWMTIINQPTNSTMTCLTTDTDDCRPIVTGSPISFVPFYRNSPPTDPATLAFGYDPRIATSGFSPKGVLCSTYDPSNPDPQCPIRIDFFWQPICPALPDTCNAPEVIVAVDFTFAFPANSLYSSLNSNQYDFDFTRMSNYSYYNLDSDSQCPANEAVSGVDADGNVTCSPSTSLTPW